MFWWIAGACVAGACVGVLVGGWLSSGKIEALQDQVDRQCLTCKIKQRVDLQGLIRRRRVNVKA